MKRKSLILIIGTLVIFLIMMLILPIRISLRETIHISSPIRIVSQQISKLKNWPHWFPALQSKDSLWSSPYLNTAGQDTILQYSQKSRLKIKQLSPAEVFAEEKNGNKTAFHTLTAVPDSFGMATNLSWTKSIPLSSWLREKLHGSNEMRNGLEKLKKNSEDPEFAYGFPIYIGPVADTLVITKKTIAPREQVVPALKNLFGELKAYAAENRILTAPYRMAAFNYHGNGEVEIMAGIPAENKAPEMNGINYLKMPRGGRMLVGKYEGPYTSLHNLYSAMEQFRIDRALQGIAVKYEKYLTDPVTHEDSLHMKIEIYYPIF